MAFLNRSVIIGGAFALYVLYREVNYKECVKLIPERDTIVFYGKKILIFGLGIGLLCIVYNEQRKQATIMNKMFENMLDGQRAQTTLMSKMFENILDGQRAQTTLMNKMFAKVESGLTIATKTYGNIKKRTGY